MWSRLKSFYQQISTLQLAIGFSVAVHVLLITVRFVDPAGFNRIFKDTPLEVVLVNAKANDKLDDLEIKAQAIAQFQLSGGGDADTGLASSPMPTSERTERGTSAEQLEAQVTAMQAQQMRMLQDIKDQVAQLSKPDTKLVRSNERAEQKRKRQQLLKLLATIERRINEENARPKKRYISPATRQESYALYYDELRRKIEKNGTQNFPESMGQKLYGELTMLITVNSAGEVLSTEIVNGGSGNKMLDNRAQAIVHQAGPYGVFTPAMRRKADQLVVASQFKFTREDGLQTQLAAQ